MAVAKTPFIPPTLDSEAVLKAQQSTLDSDAHAHTSSPESKGQEEVGGTMPAPQSDDDVSNMAKNFGISSGSPVQPLNIDKNLGISDYQARALLKEQQGGD